MKKTDYHDFYQIFIDDYLPLKISGEWLVDYEEYVDEIVFMFHRMYDIGNVTEPVAYRLLASVLETSYVHMKSNNLI